MGEVGVRTGCEQASYKKKRFKKERIHAWISNFTAEYLEEIARPGKEVFFSF